VIEMNDKAKENAKQIQSEIEYLSSGHWNMFKRQHKEFWNHAKNISNMFRTINPLSKDDRERLWEKFSVICQEVKRKQSLEQHDRQFRSEQHRKDIIRVAENARVQTLFGLDPPNIQVMKDLGVVLREASAMLSKNKDEMFGEHKQECFDRIQEIRRIHDAWWQELKKHSARRKDDFQQRVRANIDSNHERHRKASDALRRVRSHAENLRNQINGAWSDDYRERACGWLSETEDKIRDIEDSIKRIEGWIQEDEQKLR
jgi:gas vesicle protein